MIKDLRANDPATVGPYRLLGRLGSGGMGQVYLAKSPGGRLVAIKLIRTDLAEERGFRARFASEIAAARNVSGMYTAGVIDSDTEAEPPWMATAYVAGPSLADAIADDGPLPVKSVLALAAGLAEALDAIHRVGVVHRDLKPSNVLLAADGPRVIDFGISRAIERSMLTTTGVVLGSPGFMSPEQARGQREVGPPTDVFSLGAVLAYAATGEGPFGTGPTPALLYRVVNEMPDLAQVPARLRPVIESCLAKEPAERPTPAQLLLMLSSEVGVLAGEWLPKAVSDTLDRYSPTVTALTPPPPSRPAPAASPAEADLAQAGFAEPAPVESAPVESEVLGPDEAAEEPAPLILAPLASVVADVPVADPVVPGLAKPSLAAEATEPDDLADATQDIMASPGMTTTVRPKAAASHTGLAHPGEAQSGILEPLTVAAAAAAAAASAAALEVAAGAPGAAVVPAPVVLPEAPTVLPQTPGGGSGGGGTVRPPARNVSPWRRWRWPAAAAAAVIAAGVATTLALTPDSPAKPVTGPAPSLVRTTSAPATHTSARSTPTRATQSPTKSPTKKATKKAAAPRTHTPTPSADSSPSPNPVVTTSSAPPAVTSSPPSTHPVATKTTTKAAPGPQTITGVSGASSRGCSAYGSIGSASGGSAVGYSFVNNSGADMQVWFLTANGSGQPEGTVAPGGSLSPGVKTGQDWMVANSGGGCLGIFTITGGGGITVG